MPVGFTQNIFIAGLPFHVPAGGLPGGINPVTWSTIFFASETAHLNWQWSAAVYTAFSTDESTTSPR